MSPGSGLTVRQHERDTIQVSVEFVIDTSFGDQVHFSPMSSAVRPHVFQGIATDISPGGIGIESRLYIPRMTEGVVRVYDCNSIEALNDESHTHRVIFEHHVKVRRVVLHNHEPVYSLGLAFLNPPGDIEVRVNKVMAAIKELSSPASESGGNHG